MCVSSVILCLLLCIEFFIIIETTPAVGMIHKFKFTSVAMLLFFNIPDTCCPAGTPIWRKTRDSYWQHLCYKASALSLSTKDVVVNVYMVSVVKQSQEQYIIYSKLWFPAYMLLVAAKIRCAFITWWPYTIYKSKGLELCLLCTFSYWIKINKFINFQNYFFTLFVCI
jgi:hypothetical protein